MQGKCFLEKNCEHLNDIFNFPRDDDDEFHRPGDGGGGLADHAGPADDGQPQQRVSFDSSGPSSTDDSRVLVRPDSCNDSLNDSCNVLSSSSSSSPVVRPTRGRERTPANR